MFTSGPSESELAIIGLLREDVEDNSPCEVWPDNWEAFRIFELVSGQWIMSNGYRVALNYSTVAWAMDLFKVRKKKQLERLSEVRVMESAALAQMRDEERLRTQK